MSSSLIAGTIEFDDASRWFISFGWHYSFSLRLL